MLPLTSPSSNFLTRSRVQSGTKSGTEKASEIAVFSNLAQRSFNPLRTPCVAPRHGVHGSFRARLASGEFQTVECLHVPRRQFTRARTIAAEQEILQRVREGHNQMQPINSTLLELDTARAAEGAASSIRTNALLLVKCKAGGVPHGSHS